MVGSLVDSDNRLLIHRSSVRSYQRHLDLDNSNQVGDYIPVLNLPPIKKVINVCNWRVLLLTVDGKILPIVNKKIESTPLLSVPPIKNILCYDDRLLLLDYDGTVHQSRLTHLEMSTIIGRDIIHMSSLGRYPLLIDSKGIIRWGTCAFQSELPIKLFNREVMVLEDDSIVVPVIYIELGSLDLRLDEVNNPLQSVIDLVVSHDENGNDHILLLTNRGEVGLIEWENGISSDQPRTYRWEGSDDKLIDTITPERFVTIDNRVYIEDINGIVYDHQTGAIHPLPFILNGHIGS